MDHEAAVREETQERFGYQWTNFDDVFPELDPHFRRLVRPLTPADFSGKRLLDAGCGYGRYALCAAKYGAQVVGLDFSEAIFAARRVTQATDIRLVRGDILQPPFRPAFDMVMSIGVLHHLPDPLRGFEAITALVKPGGLVVLWLYSAQRRVSNFLLEQLRKVARPLPNRALHVLTFSLAVADYLIAKSLNILPHDIFRRLIPTHFRLYAELPFRASWADWFDRLGAPIRHYYTKDELESWVKRIGADGGVYPTDDFGWTVIARIPARHSGEPRHVPRTGYKSFQNPP
jgi:SAM-dependent methyltransferase